MIWYDTIYTMTWYDMIQEICYDIKLQDMIFDTMYDTWYGMTRHMTSNDMIYDDVTCDNDMKWYMIYGMTLYMTYDMT